jgi:hypothetical protein
MSEYLYLLTICLPLGTLLVIFAMKYWSAAQQARALAASQSEMASVLASIDGSLSDVRARLTAVEKILKDVE